jgi:hypothetical protein
MVKKERISILLLSNYNQFANKKTIQEKGTKKSDEDMI